MLELPLPRQEQIGIEVARFIAISSNSFHTYSGDLHSSKVVSLNDKIFLLSRFQRSAPSPHLVRRGLVKHDKMRQYVLMNLCLAFLLNFYPTLKDQWRGRAGDMIDVIVEVRLLGLSPGFPY